MINWHCNVCLVLIAVIALHMATSYKYQDEEFLVDVKDNKKYHVDFFVLAMEWPQGTCEFTNATHHHTCVIPDAVPGWVLHGLWPNTKSGGGRKHLGYCNNSMHFDYNKIKDMETDLNKYWPNLYADGKRMWFYKHEYEKHGTCAALVKGFETEHIYFKRAMEQLHEHDPLAVLKKANIVPSASGYESTRILEAADHGYGVHVCPQCSYAKGVRAVTGMEVCLTNTMQLMDCPHDCWRKFHCSGQVFYHPLHFKN